MKDNDHEQFHDSHGQLCVRHQSVLVPLDFKWLSIQIWTTENTIILQRRSLRRRMLTLGRLVQPFIHDSSILPLVPLIRCSILESLQCWKAQDSLRVDLIGQFDSHLENLLAKFDSEAAFIVPTRWHILHDPRYWIALAGNPTLSATGVDYVCEQFWVQTHFDSDV